jgi:hypothetical protein
MSLKKNLSWQDMCIFALYQFSGLSMGHLKEITANAFGESLCGALTTSKMPGLKNSKEITAFLANVLHIYEYDNLYAYFYDPGYPQWHDQIRKDAAKLDESLKKDAKLFKKYTEFSGLIEKKFEKE